MAATFVPPPPVSVPMVGADGIITRPWRAHFAARHEQAGGSVDKIEAAHATATSAAPRSTQLIVVGGLRLGGDLSGNVSIALYRAMAVVSALPATGNSEGDWAYAKDGRKPGEAAGSGTGIPCWWSAGHWVAVTGATVTS